MSDTIRETAQAIGDCEHVTVAELASDNLVLLLRWMAEQQGIYGVDDLAYAAEKPWKYDREMGLALAGKEWEPEA